MLFELKMKADNQVWVKKKFMRSYFILMTGISLGKSWLMYCGLFCSREQTLLFSFGFGKKPFQPLHPDGLVFWQRVKIVIYHHSFLSAPDFCPSLTQSVSRLSLCLGLLCLSMFLCLLFLSLYILCNVTLRCAFGKNRKYLKRPLALANSLQ